ncbi:MAG: hypothetical protein ACRYFU_17910 [Janthinobacterium lividum]
MQIVQQRTMRDEAIRLDGKHFIDCTFIHCTLEYSGGDVALERTNMHGCKHLLFGYARQTANYPQAVGLYEKPANDGSAECTSHIH